MKVVVLTLLLASLFSFTACDVNTDVESGELKHEIIDVSSEFSLDNENKYILTTDMKWNTMRNDGGSHTNTYYQIDLNTGLVRKCEDNYIGFQGYEYKGKELHLKELDEIQSNELKTILDSIVTNILEEEKLNYNYYELTLFSGDVISIYDKEMINTLVRILE